MKRIHYAGGDFVTADEIAQSLVEYAAELAGFGAAAVAVVPGVLRNGARVDVSLVIGPSSQLMVVPEEAGDIDASEAVETLRSQRDDLLRRHTMRWARSDSASLIDLT